jgi:putative FmdB family regulatory protein
MPTVPTYQYACTECSHVFEQFQSFSDDALTDCPECGGRLRKLFNAVGVVFKGSGFYRTDSRAAAGSSPSSTSPSSDGSSSSDPGSSGGTATKTESKPAPATKSSSTTSE